MRHRFFKSCDFSRLRLENSFRHFVIPSECLNGYVYPMWASKFEKTLNFQKMPKIGQNGTFSILKNSNVYNFFSICPISMFFILEGLQIYYFLTLAKKSEKQSFHALQALLGKNCKKSILSVFSYFFGGKRLQRWPSACCKNFCGEQIGIHVFSSPNKKFLQTRQNTKSYITSKTH